uniref:Uncharacterized protein n=1 Tax=Rhizophora mucronata TaxID=61149 RepID=A0A2P2PMG6_RHIMU
MLKAWESYFLLQDQSNFAVYGPFQLFYCSKSLLCAISKVPIVAEIYNKHLQWKMDATKSKCRSTPASYISYHIRIAS